MKSLAGTLKLELAQYREVQAFASFASELDETTRFTLNRGVRLVELLKQPHSQPLSVEKQILCLFAGMMGYLDTLAVSEVIPFVNFLLGFAGKVNLFLAFNVTKPLDTFTFNETISVALNEFILRR